MLKNAKKQNLPLKESYDLVFTAVVSGFIGAHLFHGAFYEQPFSVTNIFFTFQGISSVGGFLGGWIGVMIFLKAKKLSALNFADVSLWSLTVGMFFGRLGCFSVHDHPGRLSNFFLAVQFPGGSRHDLGLYEAIFLLILILVLKFHVWKKNQPLLVSQWILISYGLFRIVFDYLRAQDLGHNDQRFFDFTPAQYVGLFFIIIGFYLGQRRASKSLI